jgi:coenzyme Q-binding protein COQ10
MIESASAKLPFSRQQVFDLAADIEKYPQFLHGWMAARITQRDGNVWHVDQTMGVGPLQLKFTSKAVLDRPRRIDVTSTEGPFRRYSFSWQISELSTGGCHIGIAAEFEFRSPLLQVAANKLAPVMITDTLTSFERRAHALYDAPAA